MRWDTRATAFTWTVYQGRLLAVLHERLGTAVWEVPGGHLEADETFERAAARETLEETGVAVAVGGLMATCVHEWAERRQRRLIMFFHAVPLDPSDEVQPRAGDVGIVRSQWVDPGQLSDGSTSAFLRPLLREHAIIPGVAKDPIMFRAEHRRDASGWWRPYVVPNDGLS
ncbi:MAG: NUDIX hydrolase [Lapillicoccus sp.]